MKLRNLPDVPKHSGEHYAVLNPLAGGYPSMSESHALRLLRQGRAILEGERTLRLVLAPATVMRAEHRTRFDATAHDYDGILRQMRLDEIRRLPMAAPDRTKPPVPLNLS